MDLIVQKFGGTSVANAERVEHVADLITRTYDKGNNVLAVVSAQGKFTDVLVDKANEINPKGSRREMDVLLSAGEQISIALLALAIEKRGYPVKSMLGWQAGFVTDSNHSNARIRRINTERVQNELAKRTIIIVAGFQGLDRYDDMTTLGRGGSDTSAVALAAALNAKKCQIYTDVDGVYTADPRIVKGAKKLDSISYDEMLELATLGAQVLHNRSVEMAKRYNVDLEVLSSLEDKPGTIIKEEANVEKMIISGVAKDTNVARISLLELKDQPGMAFRIFSLLAKEKEVAKVSIVGAGMESNPGVACKLFDALAQANINIDMVSTSEIKISVLIHIDDAQRAVAAIHDKFYND